MRVVSSTVRAVLVLACASGLSCSKDNEPEPDLGGLLHAAPGPSAPNIEEAREDVPALESAVGYPHHLVAKALGAHRVRSKFETSVTSGGQSVDTLTSTLELLYDSSSSFSLRRSNDKDYGRDVIFNGTDLYLRPRFGKYHKRAPEAATEPIAVLDQMLSAPSAQLALVAPGAAVKRSRDELVSSRAAIIIELEKASSPRKRAEEPTKQRKWRESATTESITGSIALDKETGVLLSAKIESVVSYTRDGQNFRMALSIDHQVVDIGTAETITVPEEGETVAAPRLLAELEERESLLRGIAPPARRGKTPKNPDGRETPATPK